MSAPLRLCADLVSRLTIAVMPPAQRPWGEAMRQEARAIPSAGDALFFALSCLASAIGIRAMSFVSPEPVMPALLDRPRLFTALCAVAATALGLAYLWLAGAPIAYIAFNAGALVAGLLLVGIVSQVAGLIPLHRGPRYRGAAILVAALALLAVGLFGVSVQGATRWLSLAGLSIQPSLILLPVMILGFARDGGRLATLGMITAALALAVQPDRAMAGALAAGLLAVAACRPGRAEITALLAALSGFMVTLTLPDRQGAMPFVDQIIWTALDRPLAGLLLWAGLAVMLLPALAKGRLLAVSFGAMWLAIIVAAALGNYPTPLVGYGGSAIVGYVLCLLALPRRAKGDAVTAGEEAATAPTSPSPRSIPPRFSPPVIPA